MQWYILYILGKYVYTIFLPEADTRSGREPYSYFKRREPNALPYEKLFEQLQN